MSEKPPKLFLKDRVIWMLIICFGIIREELKREGKIQNEELIKKRDHKDKIHVREWRYNVVELWSSNEEKISTIILSVIFCFFCYFFLVY